MILSFCRDIYVISCTESDDGGVKNIADEAGAGSMGRW